MYNLHSMNQSYLTNRTRTSNLQLYTIISPVNSHFGGNDGRDEASEEVEQRARRAGSALHRLLGLPAARWLLARARVRAHQIEERVRTVKLGHVRVHRLVVGCFPAITHPKQYLSLANGEYFIAFAVRTAMPCNSSIKWAQYGEKILCYIEMINLVK